MIKGVIIERAKPSNVIDCYALIKDAAKEGVFPYSGPNKDTVKEYYFQILAQLSQINEIYYLARRGRTYWGVLSATVISRPWNKEPVVFMKVLYVSPKKRKLGIASGLLDRLKEECLKMGIKKIEFTCTDELLEYWNKKKSNKIMNYMMLEV